MVIAFKDLTSSHILFPVSHFDRVILSYGELRVSGFDHLTSFDSSASASDQSTLRLVPLVQTSYEDRSSIPPSGHEMLGNE